ncbi:MAG: hypothetical protein SFX73_05870 [Kofleriaceae bacterium]|nr:hypothetical protein [Kofleriaceae bacterium]
MIAIGDIYEDCAFHPVRCEGVEDEDGDVAVWGVSMIDGTRPRSCSLSHCGVIKLTEDEAQRRIEAYKADGKRGLYRVGGVGEAQIDEWLNTPE